MGSMRFGLFVLPLLALALPSQQFRWYQSPANGHLYALTPFMTWEQAEAYAVGVGGHLATARSQAEMDALAELFGTQDLWIGLSDAGVPGRYVRSSGQPAAFTSWGAGMPSAVAGANYVLATGIGWVNASGGLVRQGIVERSDLAAYTPFGSGCASTAGVPMLGAAPGSLPRLGDTFTTQITNLPTSPEAGDVFVLFGFSNTAAGPLPLPIDLSPFGIAGCTGYVSADATFLRSPMGADSVDWPLDIPSLPRLLGLTYYTQALVQESGVNSFGAVMTNAAEATLGAPSLYPTGFGPAFNGPARMIAKGTHALVVESLTGFGKVFAVDLLTGGRTVLASGSTIGTGPAFNAPVSLAMVEERVFVATAGPTTVTEIDLLSGHRTIISDDTHGTGPALGGLQGMALDGNRVLVLRTGLDPAVVAVDLVTGDRTILSDAATGLGPSFNALVAIAVDGNRALVADGGLAAVVAVDLATGDRAILSDAVTGTGPALLGPLGITVDGNRALVTDRDLDAVVAVDLASGDRTIVSGPGTGNGPAFQTPFDVVVDGNRALVTDFLLDMVVAVDLQTGDRSVFSKQ